MIAASSHITFQTERRTVSLDERVDGQGRAAIALTARVRRAELGMKIARVYRIRFTASSMTIPRSSGSGTRPTA